MTLTMQRLMEATPKTMRTSCDTGFITTALSPSPDCQKCSCTFSCCPVPSWKIWTVSCPLHFASVTRGTIPGSIQSRHSRFFFFFFSPSMQMELPFLSHSASTHKQITRNLLLDPATTENTTITAVIWVLQGLFFVLFFLFLFKLNVAPVKMSDTVLQL